MGEAGVMNGEVDRLVGVYDADGSLRGELAYWVGARFGRAHCALCDITHGTFRERADWRACRDGLAVEFDTVHRDELPDGLAEVIGPLPAVAAAADGAWHLLLGPDDLEACAADPERLVAAVTAAAEAAGLSVA